MKNNKFIPERLTEAREIRGYTKADLSNLLGLSRQAISQFENHTSIPSVSTLISLSQVLEMPLNYLLTQRPRTSTRTSPIFFRKYNSATKMNRIQATRLEEWFTDIYEYLSKYFDFPSINLFEYNDYFTTIEDDDIEDLSLKLRKFWGLGDGPISNMTRLVENNGLTIGKTKLSGKLDSYSCWRGQRTNIILTSSARSAVRLRFDIAHEIGHLILHKYIDEEEFEDSTRHKVIEEQANKFASALLMPATTFVQDFISSSLEALLYLKKRWLVSIQAIAIRCYDLGLINENQKEYIFKRLNLIYGRKKEPLDDEIILETPVLLSRGLENLIDSGIITRDELLKELNLPIQQLIELSSIDPKFFDLKSHENVIELKIKSPYKPF